MTGPTLQTRQHVDLPTQSLIVLNVKANISKEMEGGLFKVVPNFLLSGEYPELVLIPTIHNVEVTKTQCIPFILLNLSEEEISLGKGEILGHLEEADITVEKITTGAMLQNLDMETENSNCDVPIDKEFITSPADVDTHRKVKLQDAEVLNKTVGEITTETMLQSENMEFKKLHCDISLETTEAMLQNEDMESEKLNCSESLEKMFITSPADVDTHRKVKLQDAEVLDHYKKEFEELCEKYKDIFSKDSSDIGKTPLITMEIETGDSPPVCQRPTAESTAETCRLGPKGIGHTGKGWSHN